MIAGQKTLVVNAGGRGFVRIDGEIGSFVAELGVQMGLVNCFVRHSSASLVITENADPDVLSDLEMLILDVVKDGDERCRHNNEGPDDMSAHMRSVLTATTLDIPVVEGNLALGVWQGVFLWEHRQHELQRQIVLTVTS